MDNKKLDSKENNTQYDNIPAVRVDDFDLTNKKFNNLDLYKEANRSALAKNKNKLASILILILLGFMITNTASYGWETDRTVKQIYVTQEYSQKEKLELDRQLNKEFHDEATDRYFPLLTLIIGYIIKEISED